MKTVFVAEIESAFRLEGQKGTVKLSHRVEAKNPQELLNMVQHVNGGKVPTVEKLLTHLFVEGAAYAQNNFVIFIKYSEVNSNEKE